MVNPSTFSQDLYRARSNRLLLLFHFQLEEEEEEENDKFDIIVSVKDPEKIGEVYVFCFEEQIWIHYSKLRKHAASL